LDFTLSLELVPLEAAAGDLPARVFFDALAAVAVGFLAFVGPRTTLSFVADFAWEGLAREGLVLGFDVLTTGFDALDVFFLRAAMGRTLRTPYGGQSA
jgi:hypothetical protein